MAGSEPVVLARTDEPADAAADAAAVVAAAVDGELTMGLAKAGAVDVVVARPAEPVVEGRAEEGVDDGRRLMDVEVDVEVEVEEEVDDELV